ncbi:hypothetical protein [Cupriavidus nantongensis]|uniref:hypothetical protein n=1 Tax=Cupriavidus nantongensis TaxID=1796606 RepID=UPI00396A4FD0
MAAQRTISFVIGVKWPFVLTDSQRRQFRKEILVYIGYRFLCLSNRSLLSLAAILLFDILLNFRKSSEELAKRAGEATGSIQCTQWFFLRHFRTPIWHDSRTRKKGKKSIYPPTWRVCDAALD